MLLGADGDVRALQEVVLDPSVGLPSGLDQFGPDEGVLVVADVDGQFLDLLLQVLGRVLREGRQLVLQLQEALHVRQQLVGVDGVLGVELADLHEEDLGAGHGVDGHGVEAEEGQLLRRVHRRLAEAGEGVMELGPVGADGGLPLVLDLSLGTGVAVVVRGDLGAGPEQLAGRRGPDGLPVGMLER